MNLHELVKSLANEKLVDEDGERCVAKVIPLGSGMNEKSFRANPPRIMQPEFAELSAKCAGLCVGCLEVLFTEHHLQGFGFLIEDWMGVLEDGFGNHWVMELGAHDPAGPVWFVCHDPPVMTLAATTLAEFLDLVVDMFRQRPRHAFNPIRDPHGDAMRIYRDSARRGVLAKTPRSSGDAALARVAQSLPDDAMVFDLRVPATGGTSVAGVRGFVWEGLDPYADHLPTGHAMIRAGRVRTDT